VISATADWDNRYVESNESNNSDSDTYYTGVDLSIAVEVAAPPVCQHGWRDDVDVPGNYNWLLIPYRVFVTNLDKENTSPGVDIVMTYYDMWTSSSITSQDVVWLPSIEPTETEMQGRLFYLDVPTDDNCSGPTGAIDVSFIADGNAESIHDSDRSNNSVHFTVDANYWRPDYTIRNITQIGLGALGKFPSRIISYAVRNIGPTNVSSQTGFLKSVTEVLDAYTNVFFSESTSDLDPGDEQTYQVSLDVDDCELVTYSISADHLDSIDEFDEHNNIADVRLHPVTSPMCLEVDHKNEHEAELAWIQQHGVPGEMLIIA
jgi:hypothetical protein